MIQLDELLNKLEYTDSPHYRPTDGALIPETAHLFRAASEAGVSGIYVFETSPNTKHRLLPARPAVYVAAANSEQKARQIHRELWNLGYAPFLIIKLPHQIRIYTGFDFSPDEKKEQGLLVTIDTAEELRLLADFASTSIDSGHIWKKYAEKLNPDRRVDKRLLKNLKQLGEILGDSYYNLPDEIAHALIGKYIYLRYLRDRNILTDKWLIQQQITETSHRVFTRDATVYDLQTLVEALEKRVNGKVFPLQFDKLRDEHISLVASVIFCGDEIKDAPNKVKQLYLPFHAYDFRYIPVETLSAIYEQFIHDPKGKGAVYTPEVLADYLISEVESVKQLERGLKMLDPACGSGVFLVLAYRRLIEQELTRRGRQKLKPEELSSILLESIYGVERERDACYVTAFSLILTLLHYSEPQELENLEFELPDLYDSRVFECDFFNLESKFWQQEIKFDWVIGNPPWVRSKREKQIYADTWILNNKVQYSVGDNSVAEAFSWLVTELLSSNGIAGLLLPATSLFNLKSRKYRQQFFSAHEVFRVTNFANLRDVLFERRSTLPAATIIYRQAVDARDKSHIVHYAPLSANSVLGARKRPWLLTINESEIQTISSYEAEKGDTATWKFALWGTYFDKRVIERIRHTFPTTLEEVCEERDWAFHRNVELRDGEKETKEKLEYTPELQDKKLFRADLMDKEFLRFSIPRNILEDIPSSRCYIRVRGGKNGLKIIGAPHIMLSPTWMSYILYSDKNFVTAPLHLCIAASQEDANHLKALSVYLKSGLVAHYLFFHAQEWGVFRQARRVSFAEVKKIPTPIFTSEQIQELAILQSELVKKEKREILNYVLSLRVNELNFGVSHTPIQSIEFDSVTELTEAERKRTKNFVVSNLRPMLQREIDDAIFNMFKIPHDIRVLVNEFVQIRLQLDSPAAITKVIRKPDEQELSNYARELRDELDDFVMGTAHHRVVITHSDELIECAIEITHKDAAIPVDIQSGNLTTARIMAELSDSLREQVSQWVYIQRGLRLFDGPRIYIYKSSRLIDWTRTQAMLDAGDIIGELVETQWRCNENNRT